MISGLQTPSGLWALSWTLSCTLSSTPSLFWATPVKSLTILVESETLHAWPLAACTRLWDLTLNLRTLHPTFGLCIQPSDFASDLQTLYPNPGTSCPTSWTFVSTSGTLFPLLGPLGPPFRTLPCQNCGYCRGAHPPGLWSTPLGPSWPTPSFMPTLTLWVTSLSLLDLTWPTPNLGTRE